MTVGVSSSSQPPASLTVGAEGARELRSSAEAPSPMGAAVWAASCLRDASMLWISESMVPVWESKVPVQERRNAEGGGGPGGGGTGGVNSSGEKCFSHFFSPSGDTVPERREVSIYRSVCAGGAAHKQAAGSGE